jgi:hypothetical protein
MRIPGVLEARISHHPLARKPLSPGFATKSVSGIPLSTVIARRRVQIETRGFGEGNE